MPRSAFKTSISFVGDWPGTARKLRQLDPVLREGFQRAMEEVAYQYYEKIVGHLYGQDIPGWKKLSKGRLKARERRGIMGNTPLLATQTYVQSINVFREGKNWVVGIKKGLKHPESKKLKVDQIAALHEALGDRPLWAYTFNNRGKGGMGGELGIRRFVTRYMEQYLKNRGY